ncbi:hypothetical protein BDR04DRAFT_1109982 [Suillus decipiens]|nr:hypothetical protein BDR04DRAFT_1109982 [Suillus decipiens]
MRRSVCCIPVLLLFRPPVYSEANINSTRVDQIVPFQGREPFEMLVDGLPTPNTIIVHHILDKHVRVKVDTHSRRFLVLHLVSVDCVKGYAYTKDSDDCGRTFEFHFLTIVCTLRLH